jgi:hypothetical protein
VQAIGTQPHRRTTGATARSQTALFRTAERAIRQGLASGSLRAVPDLPQDPGVRDLSAAAAALPAAHASRQLGPQAVRYAENS